MNQISDLLKREKVEKLSKSERTQAIKEIFAIYNSLSEKKLRRDENIKRYRIWLKENKLHHEKDNSLYIIFTRTGKFLREIKPASMAYFLSHVKTPDLYLVKSVCKDRCNRGQSVGQYIISLTFPKK